MRKQRQMALVSFERALKSKNGPLFPIQAEIAMLRSRYESEARKWNESLDLARSHDRTLHGDKDNPDIKPGVVACLRSIRQVLNDHVALQAKINQERVERQKHLLKVFYSTLIATLTSLIIGGIWVAFHLPVVKS